MSHDLDLTGVLTETQMIQLLRTADRWLCATGRRKRPPRNPHWRHQIGLFAWIALTTGLRSSEILRMRWEWINLESQTARVLRHKKRTTTWTRGVRYSGAKPSNVELVTPLVERLRRFAKSAGYLFTPASGPYDESPHQVHNLVISIRRYGKYLFLEAGIPLRRNHDFRHTAAVMLFRKTRNVFAVQEMLGHTNLETSCVYMRHVERPTASALESIFAAV